MPPDAGAPFSTATAGSSGGETLFGVAVSDLAGWLRLTSTRGIARAHALRLVDFTSLLLGASQALMLRGTVTFVVKFIIMPCLNT